MSVKITSDSKTRTAKRYTTFENGWNVETWWDRAAHSWVTQIKNEKGWLIDDALFAGSDGGKNEWARMNHEEAIGAVINRHETERGPQRENEVGGSDFL